LKKQKPRIIEDKKQRGEWAESVFMARANEHGLPVSKPWGELSSYDFVIGKTGRFVSVQVKSTLSKLKTGYVCTVRGGHRAYDTGSFDFLAAYVVPEDAWYIIPAKLIHGKECIALYPNSPAAKYEKYREAWEFLREAVVVKEETKVLEVKEMEVNEEASQVEEPVESIPRNALDGDIVQIP
jgi:PD-(D/E)XK endonuclease